MASPARSTATTAGAATCDMGAYEYSTFEVTASAGTHGSLDASTPSPQSAGFRQRLSASRSMPIRTTT